MSEGKKNKRQLNSAQLVKLLRDNISENDEVTVIVEQVNANAIDIGKRISDKFKGKFIILDIEREVVRIIFNDISIDIANRISPTIEGDLKNRDFSINAIAFLFDKNCLLDPLNGIKDIELSLLRTYSPKNLLDDPLRILRCFRFVSELNFKIDHNLKNFIKKYRGKTKRLIY